MNVRYKHTLLVLAAFFISIGKSFAADTMAGIFNDKVKTLKIGLLGSPLSQPIIFQGTDDQLLISFDHLSDEREYLRYELVHCNADWQPSGLVDSEFLDGFNYGDINDYRYSQATSVPYVHYEFCMPNEHVAPKLSGNYLLKVYPENDAEDVWLQCRFFVSEQSAPISAQVTSRTDVDYNSRHQQLSIVVDTERASVPDPFNELTLMVQQNGRYDNERALRQPLRMSGRFTSYYEHQQPLIFDAGNEYRRMETVSLYNPSMGVESVEYHEPYYHITLETDIPRSDMPYQYDQTQYGRFFIREYNSIDSDVEADYAVVHFTLDMPEQIEGNIFLDGDFVNRRFDPESMMVYNRATGLYERYLLLKQGAYNYQYLYVPFGDSRGSAALIEGDKYQTVNEYLIKAYTRHPGDRYDRLIGVTTIYSGL